MKLTAIILFVTIIQVQAAVYGQTLTLKSKNVRIARLFDEIERQTGYDVFYSPKVLNTNTMINVDFKNTSLSEVLRHCLEGQPVTYTIDDKTIIIRRKEALHMPVGKEQTLNVSGTVVGENGQALVGASVQWKGTNRKVTTNEKGEFVLHAVNENAILMISYIGYDSKEIKAQKYLGTIRLALSVNELTEVTVTTAYGMEKRTKELGYSVGKVTGEELNRTNPGNILTGLTGKISGLVISNQGAGMTPDNNIMLRGIRSINSSANNQPLIVLNGSPLSFGSDQNSAALAIDFINNLNPNDVEDVTVLKGANGSAMYGPEGVNGVIIINTKKGNKQGVAINARTSTSFQVLDWSKRKVQQTFGAGELVDEKGNPIYNPTTTNLWGPAYNDEMVPLGRPDENGDVQMVPYSYNRDREKFWNKARNTQHNLSASQADDRSDFYLGLTYADQTGLVPKDKKNKAGVLLNTGRNFGKWSVRVNAGYNNTTSDESTGASTNGIPPHVPLLSYKDYINNKWADRNHYWADRSSNPYETIDNIRIKSAENALVGNLELKISPLSWLTIIERPGLTFSSYYQKKTSKPLEYSDYAKELGMNGRSISMEDQKASVAEQTLNMITVNNDLLVSTFFRPGNFSIKTTLGNTVRQSYAKQLEGFTSRLVTPVYNLSFSEWNEIGANEKSQLTRFYSFFGTALVGYRDRLFLELTGRNDWDSKLAVSARSKNFYAGANFSAVLQELLPSLQSLSWLSNARLRASITKTANMNIEPYQSERLLRSSWVLGEQMMYEYLPNVPNPTIKPEHVLSQEYGGNFAFINNRIEFDVTYYRQRNNGLILDVVNSIYSGAPTTDNAGVYDNWGWEFDLNGKKLLHTSGGLTANAGVRLAINDNRVVSLPPVYNGQLKTYAGSVQVLARTGNHAYEFALRDWLKDDKGRIIVDAVTGMPSLDYDNPVIVGRTLPKYTASANLNLEWKGFSFSALGEYRGGNEQYNAIGASGASMGSSLLTTYNNRQPFVVPNSVYEDGQGNYIENKTVKVSSIQEYWQEASSVTTNFLINAGFFTLRELAISYELPLKSKFLKNMSIGAYGRDLWTIYAKNNIYGDPQNLSGRGRGSEQSKDLQEKRDSNFGNAGSQADRIPGTKQYGFVINIGF